MLLFVGFICFKCKIVDQAGNKAFSSILLLVIQPAAILLVYHENEFTAERARLLGIAFIAAIASHIIMIAISRLVFTNKNNVNIGIDQFSVVYSNSGFIGIPLISATIGSEGVFFLSAYIAIFNLFLWTHGASSIKGSFSFKNIKKGIFSPVFLITMLAIVMYFMRLEFQEDSVLRSIEELIFRCVGFLANTMTALAMLVAGLSIAQVNIIKMITKLRTYWIVFVKGIIVPLTITFVMYLFNVDTTVALTMIIAAACPTAIGGAMMAMNYDKDYKYATEIFAISTILAIITIPAVVIIAEMIV